MKGRFRYLKQQNLNNKSGKIIVIFFYLPSFSCIIFYKNIGHYLRMKSFTFYYKLNIYILLQFVYKYFIK